MRCSWVVVGVCGMDVSYGFDEDGGCEPPLILMRLRFDLGVMGSLSLSSDVLWAVVWSYVRVCVGVPLGSFGWGSNWLVRPFACLPFFFFLLLLGRSFD